MACILSFLCCFLFSSCLMTFPAFSDANQGEILHKLLMSKFRSPKFGVGDSWAEQATDQRSSVFVGPQDGLMQADKISKLPGEPAGTNFNQYSGYVTVDPKAGRALFYYFAESPQNSSINPLVLWLNGGPGCSSLGDGAMQELGPFRVNSDGKSLYRNPYSWNEVANVIFLESPAGVGFSYSNTSEDYQRAGDSFTANDSYTFLVNWLERFPQYKNRDFYIAGESYAGHYVPQLADKILRQNMSPNQTHVINLKGIAIGNAVIDDTLMMTGIADFLWNHAVISDETHYGLRTNCDLVNGNFSDKCITFLRKALGEEIGALNIYNIYAPICLNKSLTNISAIGSVHKSDPCADYFVRSYLNIPAVQRALHVNSTNWTTCRTFNWSESSYTILPIIKHLMANRIRVWVYSGNVDARVPITYTRYTINTLKLPIVSAWRPWSSNFEVGGYVVEYKGLVLATVRGAGHLVPKDQPERVLTMFSSFLQGHLPPLPYYPFSP